MLVKTFLQEVANSFVTLFKHNARFVFISVWHREGLVSILLSMGGVLHCHIPYIYRLP